MKSCYKKKKDGAKNQSQHGEPWQKEGPYPTYEKAKGVREQKEAPDTQTKIHCLRDGFYVKYRKRS